MELWVQARVDGAEHLAYLATEYGQDTDNYDSDKYEDQSVLYQALAFFFSKKTAKHCELLKK
jgi:hypothetical protein